MVQEVASCAVQHVDQTANAPATSLVSV